MMNDNDNWKPDYSITPRRIVCAAIIYDELIIIGIRHFDKIMRTQLKIIGIKETEWKNVKHGFVDQFGDFIDRKEAWKIAVDQGQIYREIPTQPGILYSEHLY